MARLPKYKKDRGGEPVLIGKCMKVALDKLGVEEKFAGSRVLVKWEDIVGKNISDNTKPVGVTDGVLTVNVANSAWLMELSRFYKNEILKKIKYELKDSSIKDIFFKLGEI